MCLHVREVAQLVVIQTNQVLPDMDVTRNRLPPRMESETTESLLKLYLKMRIRKSAIPRKSLGTTRKRRTLPKFPIREGG